MGTAPHLCQQPRAKPTALTPCPGHNPSRQFSTVSCPSQQQQPWLCPCKPCLNRIFHPSVQPCPAPRARASLHNLSRAPGPSQPPAAPDSAFLDITQPKTASPRDPWGPGATSPKLPCQLSEQPPCPAPWTCFQRGPPAPQLNSNLGTAAGQLLPGDSKEGPCLSCCPPTLPLDQSGLRAGVWLEKPLSTGAEGWSWVCAGQAL